jgi:hypothetical protein
MKKSQNIRNQGFLLLRLEHFIRIQVDQNPDPDYHVRNLGFRAGFYLRTAYK